MPVYPVNTMKYLITNEEKTQSMLIEVPRELKVQEMLDKVNEFRDVLLLSIENEKKDAEKAQKEEKDKKDVKSSN